MPASPLPGTISDELAEAVSYLLCVLRKDAHWEVVELPVRYSRAYGCPLWMARSWNRHNSISSGYRPTIREAIIELTILLQDA